jgi:hypothetical protein
MATNIFINLKTNSYDLYLSCGNFFERYNCRYLPRKFWANPKNRLSAIGRIGREERFHFG